LLLWSAFSIGNVAVRTSAQEARALPAEKTAAQLEAIILGYRANKDLAPFGGAQIRRTIAHARTVDDALNSRWYPETEVSVHHCDWVTDGATTRFTVMRSSNLRDQPGSWAIDRTEVRNACVEILRYTKQAATFVGPVGKRTSEPWSPFVQGDRMLTAMTSGGAVEMLEQANETKLVLRRTASSRNESGQVATYWVDDTHGFLPVRVELGRPSMEPDVVALCDALFQTKAGGWVPGRCIRIARTGQADRPYYVTLDVIVEWDFDERPNAEAFHVAVTPGESFSYESPTGSSSLYRSLSGDIAPEWFKEDGSIQAPEGAFELIPRPIAPAVVTESPRQPAVEAWEFGLVVAISVAVGFGCLVIVGCLHRRRFNAQKERQSDREREEG
jgi:hypothetical protein